MNNNTMSFKEFIDKVYPEINLSQIQINELDKITKKYCRKFTDTLHDK